MEENDRESLTSLIADLEEEQEVPLTPPNSSNIIVRGTCLSLVSGRTSPERSDDTGTGTATLASSIGSVNGLFTTTPTSSSPDARRFDCGHSQSASQLHQPHRRNAGKYRHGPSQSAFQFRQPQRRQRPHNNFQGSSLRGQTSPQVPTAELPRTMPLRNWILLHANNSQVNSNPTRNNISWRGGGQPNKANKQYLEQSVQIALSLAIKLENNQTKPFIHVDDVVLGNAVIVDTRSREADFIKRSVYSNGGYIRNQRSEIYALGQLFYEMFTQGSPPPPSKNARHANAPNSTAFESSSSFGTAMRISMDDEACKNEDDEFEQRSQRRRCDDQVGEQNTNTLLREKGMPSSICRLVTDMLENGTANDGSGDLFSHDNAISTFRDLIVDLKQMIDNPACFLHDSLIMRWKPVVANKMYCRDAELHQALDVAGRIYQCDNGAEELGNQFVEPLKAQKEVLMVFGHSGSGKSRFVRELSIKLEEKGWRCLHCKFDRVNPKPLSFIASAFDTYFSELLNNPKREAGSVESDNQELTAIQKRLEPFTDERLSILCHLIPSLRHVVPRKELSHDAGFYGGQLEYGDSEASTCRLHHLFASLVNAISQKPVMLFLDDLHWADQTSLDLIVALISAEIHDDATLDSSEATMLLVGSFRANEVDTSHPLATSFQQIKQLRNVKLTEIALDGLSYQGVNLMVSEALFYPQRLTAPLSSLIHEKSAGNPLFLKEILNDLAVENLLNYSLNLRKWEWDYDLIRDRTISDDVAEILTRRLRRLPDNMFTALQVLSIFGSKVPMEVLSHVRDVCGIDDIVVELDCAQRENLVKESTGSFIFVHDMIQHAVHESIEPELRSNMLKEIIDSLLVRTSEDRVDAILFILVDLINRGGTDGASSTSQSLQFANLNLKAGEKAIQTPDYHSASTYLDHGISFLTGDYWSESYMISLRLYERSVFVKYALREEEVMMTRLNEVLTNARSYFDKLDSLSSLTLHLTFSTDAGSTGKVFRHCFGVLEEIGERFPATPENEFIGRELIDVKKELEDYETTSISNLRPMVNAEKVKAMDLLAILLIHCFKLRSRFLPIVACRVIRITLQYGMHEKSALGFCGLASAYANVFKDVSEGYRLGKYALAAIITKKSIPEVYAMLFGVLHVWKEPLQAILPQLMDGYKIGMETGNILYSFANAFFYIYRAFMSGSKLSSFSKELLFFYREFSHYKHRQECMAMTCFSTAIVSLVGCNHTLVVMQEQEDLDCDQILAQSLAIKEMNLAETVVVCKMMCSFMFRDLDEAESVARQYLNFFDQHESAILNFINIYRYFYGGLIAFDRFRKSGHQSWMDIGEGSISKFEVWNAGCEWNFQNKLLLLQAEHHFARRNMNEASVAYNLAISAARDHRFTHEHGLSCELAGIFHRTRGRKEESTRFMRQAVECYKSWGANAKVDALLRSLE